MKLKEIISMISRYWFLFSMIGISILGIIYCCIMILYFTDKVDKTFDKIENKVGYYEYPLPDNVPGWNMLEIMAFKELRLNLYDIGVKNKGQYISYDSSIVITYNIMRHSQLTIDKVDSIWNYYNDEKMGLKLRRVIQYYAEDEEKQTATF